MSISLLFYILALICFVLKAFGVETGRVDLGWLGAAFFTAGRIIG